MYRNSCVFEPCLLVCVPDNAKPPMRGDKRGAAQPRAAKTAPLTAEEEKHAECSKVAKERTDGQSKRIKNIQTSLEEFSKYNAGAEVILLVVSAWSNWHWSVTHGRYASQPLVKRALFMKMFKTLLSANDINDRARKKFTKEPMKSLIEAAIHDLLHYATREGIIGRRTAEALQKAWIDMHKKKRGARNIAEICCSICPRAILTSIGISEEYCLDSSRLP